MAIKQQSFQLGKWRVEPEAGEIFDGVNSVKVAPRLMHLLELLVEDAGKTVSRESLIDSLWPRGYVNEEALSRAVNELRSLLRDDARNPEFIRTVPKKGYRLIAKVGEAEQGHGSRWPWPSVLLGGGAAVAAFLFFVLLRTPAPTLAVDILSTAARLTSAPGLEWHPEISPNGKWVAQVVARQGRGAIQLFPAADPEQKREIEHPDGLYSPVFSPDSSHLATLSGRGEDCAVLLWPVVGAGSDGVGEAEQAGSCYRLSAMGGLDWSADGRWLAVSTRDPESGATVISRIRLSDGSVFPLTRLSDPYQSDQRPRFSPDNRWLSFSRGTRAVRELWILDLSHPDSPPRSLTSDGQFTSGHDWWPDSAAIIFDSDRSGHRALWWIDLDGDIELLGARNAQLPSISDHGDILFQDAQFEANIWKLDVASGNLDSQPLISSTKYDSMPAWSPDGSEIAFSSNRTDDGGIWIAGADGSRVRMVYQPGEGRAIGPSWVEGGTALLATVYSAESQRIVRIALNRREVLVVESPGDRPYAPSESPDRQWIYMLAGAESGGAHLWRIGSRSPDQYERVIEGPLVRYQVSEDGTIYFTRFRESGLWRRRPGMDARPEAVIEDFPPWAGEDWVLHEEWIYHVAEDGLHRMSLVNGRVEKISNVLPSSLGPSFDVHPDGHSILLSRTDRAESDLFLARARPE